MKSKRVTALADQIVELAIAGASTRDIADLLGCSRTNVNRVRRAHGISAPVYRGGKTLINRRTVAALTRAGLTTSEIAVELNCSRRTVERARADTGVARPAPRPFTDDELDRAEELLADGASVREIERTLGRPFGSLSRRLRGRGWSHLEVSRFGALCSRTARAERERAARDGSGPQTTSQPWSPS